jgi:pantothenate synthetase
MAQPTAPTREPTRSVRSHERRRGLPRQLRPDHLGHLDVIERAAARFDRVVVAVLENPSKQALFTSTSGSS